MNIEGNLFWSHQTLRKTAMITSNIEKNSNGHIKHQEKLVGLHQTLRKSVMVYQTSRKLLWSHQILRIEFNCYNHIKYRENLLW